MSLPGLVLSAMLGQSVRPQGNCGCWMGKAVRQSELVRVSPDSPEEGLQLCSAWSWDLPLHGLAVPGRRMAACCAGMQGGLWALLVPPQH